MYSNQPADKNFYATLQTTGKAACQCHLPATREICACDACRHVHSAQLTDAAHVSVKVVAAVNLDEFVDVDLVDVVRVVVHHERVGDLIILLDKRTHHGPKHIRKTLVISV